MEDLSVVITLVIVSLISGCVLGASLNINSTNKIERQIKSLQTQGCKEEWKRYYGEHALEGDK